MTMRSGGKGGGLPSNNNNNNGSRNTHNNNAGAQHAKADDNSNFLLELEQNIQLAEYENKVDPYRGIRKLVDHSSSATNTNQDVAAIDSTEGSANDYAKQRDEVGPWRRECSNLCFDTISSNHRVTSEETETQQREIVNNIDLSVVSPLGDAQRRVIAATGGALCPSLVHWTENRSSECVLGRRPDDDSSSYRCACDYNPFCLASVGGVMGDILEESYRKQEKQRTQQLQTDNMEADNDSDHDDDVVVVEDASTTTQGPDWTNASSPCYASKTSSKLKSVRKYQYVDEAAVRQYLQDILQSLTAVLSIDECIQRIREMHAQMLFQNPLLDDEDDEDDENNNDNNSNTTGARIRLALPPGIENLGATCYLNTQLQCLAQNRVFCQGVAAWRVASDNLMSKILSLFQQLLSNMNCGWQNTVSTIEFSNALGLDHYEQQDPNEFSRLLFDRMHESFQANANQKKQQPSSSSSSDNNDSRRLAELLPRLFEGELCFKMTCWTCRETSYRTEEFTDLNLPIVRSTNKKSSPAKGQHTILDAVGKTADTDVQQCLDLYCSEETMEGDNQYQCNHCKCKRDATREIKFRKLPPVLNLQLLRFVFDREKLRKVKLHDKVLLPLELSVEESVHVDPAPSNSAARSNGGGNTAKVINKRHRYLLCAVMRHKGNSVNSGHYMAESMDWLTGQWFEFNDEKVVLLQSGPSNSINVGNNNGDSSVQLQSNSKSGTTTSKKQKDAATKVSGSQDAYSMYYVEESFLAQSALDALRKKRQNGNDDEGISVEDRAAVQRSEVYADLTRMCLEDGQANGRLERRRDFIRTKMFPGPLNCQLTNPDDLIWVEATTLRRFMSCKDRLEDVLLAPQNDRSVLQHHELLCRHEIPGLHPRVARKGKLLPKVAYEAYIAALQQERRALTMENNKNEDDDEEEDESAFNDCVIVPSHHLVCQQCSDDYRLDLKKKLEFVKTLKFLYEKLDPSEKQFSLELGPNETTGNECDRYGYRVSRRFVTWFRREAEKMMKKAASAAADAKGGDFSATDVELSAENMAEGLDGLNLSKFEMFESENGKETVDDKIRVQVNGFITCPHGNFEASREPDVQTVHRSVWGAITKLFPLAIVHEKKLTSSFDSFGNDSGEENNSACCPKCQVDRIAETSLTDLLVQLAQVGKGSPSCKALTNRDILQRSTSNENANYRILHQDDLKAWNRFLAAFQRRGARGAEKPVREIVLEAIVPKTAWSAPRNLVPQGKGSDVVLSDRNRLALLAQVFRPVVCSAHGRPTGCSVFQPRTDETDDSPFSLSDHVSVIDGENYKEFVDYVIALSIILFPSDEQQASSDLAVDDYIQEAGRFREAWQIDSLHPLFKLACNTGTSNKDNKFSISTGGMTSIFTLEEDVCRDDECTKCYDDWHSREMESEQLAHPASKNAATLQSSGTAHDPITVDWDEECEPTSAFSKGSNGKNMPASEKGFRGTFLSSAFPKPTMAAETASLQSTAAGSASEREPNWERKRQLLEYDRAVLKCEHDKLVQKFRQEYDRFHQLKKKIRVLLHELNNNNNESTQGNDGWVLPAQDQQRAHDTAKFENNQWPLDHHSSLKEETQQLQKERDTLEREFQELLRDCIVDLKSILQ